jgi:cytochrome oxidase Cu insertion factor (SCO1/SenC/PrrC family)
MRRTFPAILALLIAGAPVTSRAASEALPLPAPGSYTLNHIQRIPFAIVLEANYVPRTLARYTRNAITLLSFVYTSCGDPEGCPRAWDTFESIRLAITSRPDLHGKVRLVFVSLDPRRDTPQMLQVLSRSVPAEPAIVPWHFLTTYATAFHDRLLREMGAEISIDRTSSNGGTVVLNHMLKVFLVDNQGWVREIYASATLDPNAILGDIATLLTENPYRAE